MIAIPKDLRDKHYDRAQMVLFLTALKESFERQSDPDAVLEDMGIALNDALSNAEKLASEEVERQGMRDWLDAEPYTRADHARSLRMEGVL
ncbi:hypothetical protein AA103196_0991 [Ameyamaea chiangmaiensis NBRC 103196]|uniref:Uncharacterized protein n=1 Tax=Ameyamaea chiangmaiensis TaxID=442969 RepID=A0A850P8S5_9PROT|nr:hypothetical protein [Ameyamaea chiangmaiensis]MBS4074617.1 hypothetical protein [Ameyamaea chiangmaiensis]NVN39373.1 hypothetical protein [Ameyamaea chiangmaiensis]GBQ64861.1 hypothetical protein AA103196_0991 [Ameyamaea chiangmaiensis NBRC 103196]